MSQRCRAARVGGSTDPEGLGTEITLKDSDAPDTRWTVDEIGQPVARSAIKRGWHNDI